MYLSGQIEYTHWVTSLALRFLALVAGDDTKFIWFYFDWKYYPDVTTSLSSKDGNRHHRHNMSRNDGSIFGVNYLLMFSLITELKSKPLKSPMHVFQTQYDTIMLTRAWRQRAAILHAGRWRPCSNTLHIAIRCCEFSALLLAKGGFIN